MWLSVETFFKIFFWKKQRFYFFLWFSSENFSEFWRKFLVKNVRVANTVPEELLKTRFSGIKFFIFSKNFATYVSFLRSPDKKLQMAQWNCFLSAHSDILKNITCWKEKFRQCFPNFGRRNFDSCWEIFSTILCKFLLSVQRVFLGKFFSKKLEFQVFFRGWSETRQNFSGNLSAGLSKMNSTCCEEQFREVLFAERSLYNVLSDFGIKKFGLEEQKQRTSEKYPQQDCQNCILRVQRNILRKMFGVFSYFFPDFRWKFFSL